MGFALSIHTAGHLVPAVARVELAPGGDVVVVSPLPEIGSETPTALRQMVADTLHCGLERVQVQWADTRNTPEDFGIHGSRGVFVTGQCAVTAARQVETQLRELGAELLGAPAEQIMVEDGLVRAPNGSGPSLTFAEVAAFAQEAGTPVQGEGRMEETNAVWGFGAHFAEVEVDTDTGEVRVVRLVAAADVGRAINPLIVAGQLEGAAVMGIGYALTEELIYDPVVRGTMLNPNLLGYELPTIRDVPIVEPIIVESYEPLHPFGAKGCGEMGLIGVPPAIANAVAQATGLRFATLPITPPKVLEALERQEAAR
jgi:xanthine dehydrogenase molybdenum-binding subunit